MSSTETSAPAPAATAETMPPLRRARRLSFRALASAMTTQLWPTAKYLTRTDVHTFAFSVAANAILSFFPFVVLLLTLVRRVFHSESMFDVVLNLLRDYLPVGQDFVIRNLTEMVRHNRVQVISVVMLLISSTGIFLPLEVALNEVWRIKKNRSYLGNQLIALGLAFGCGILALTSVALTATNQFWLRVLFFGSINVVSRVVGYTVMKVFAIAASIMIFFLIYWLLPNGKVPARAVLPAAILAGLIMEIAKYAYIRSLPWLNFKEVYGPFSISVTLIFWAFLSGLLLLAGAHLSAAGVNTTTKA